MSQHLDTLRLMADRYPGGRPAIALRLHKSDETLRKELAGTPGFKLGQQDAKDISMMCIEVHSDMCFAYIDLLNAEAGGQFFRMPGSESETHRRFSSVLREFSDVADEVAELDDDEAAALAAGRRPGLRRDRVRRVRKEWMELVHEGNCFVGGLERLLREQAKQDKPD